MEDTIVAIATPLGIGGISVVRLSGRKSFPMIESVFRGHHSMLSQWKSHTVHHGIIYEGQDVYDEVLVTVMKGPKSYTTEDVVEISCHGGMVTGKRILDLLISKGARLAQPGEFTKRAFLNGRIDLTQAEAIHDIVHAQTEGAQVAAVSQLQGHLYRRLEKLYEHLANALAHVEAHIDFPEEDITPATRERLMEHVKDAIGFQQQLIRTARDGRVLREGIRTVIVGKPNVGKSSLLNALLGEDRAIVSSRPGTTRDVLEEVISLDGLPLRIMDTAGLRASKEEVELEGMARTRRNLEIAELVILVLDQSRRLTPVDKELLNTCKEKPLIVVLNKSDLPSAIDETALSDYTSCKLSLISGEGLEGLKKLISTHLWQGKTRDSFREIFVNSRHQEALRRSQAALERTAEALREKRAFEFVAADMREALRALGEITGRTVTEDILDKIFSSFCIGK